ncbi:MAG TPA: 2-hydroxyacyl-CoA dehydratase family protein [Candidatus Acidoferrales bacterium]|nr:2-hydroxyacyl-CoA dehydratase family protein [Candidatus Acidoferrales bacterium]
MSYEDLVKSSEQRLAGLSSTGRTIVAYVYPHIPLELFLAHGITPSLLWADPTLRGGFEGSIQTFACSLTRNLLSRRSIGGLSSITGILLPSNTCDSLLNVGDIWSHRFPKDKFFRLTYPAARFDEDAVQFLAEELRILSESLKNAFGRPFSIDDLQTAIALVNRFRDSAQTLYACRMIDSTVIRYATILHLVRDFLTIPDNETVDRISNYSLDAWKKLEEKGKWTAAQALRGELLNGAFSDARIAADPKTPRIVVAGGMTEPLAVQSLFHAIGTTAEASLVTDSLTFGFKTVFTPQVKLDGDPFTAMSRSILNAPSEPTQEGLPKRLEFMKSLLTRLSINGLVICEQSFCDPDQFEAPSLLKVASEVGVPTLRLPIDPELSDRGRLEGRIQSFLETFDGVAS